MTDQSHQQGRLLARLLLGTFCLGSLATAPAQEKEIIGYYPSWKSADTLACPSRIPFDKLTTVNYAFFSPRTDGIVAGRDSAGDAICLSGRRGPRLTDLAHRHGVRALLSIGGWEDSGNFPAVAATETGRAAFAHSCLERLREFDFDGIDIDWEYPCYALHNGTPADRGNFTSLLRTLRDSLRTLEKASGRRYLLTAALPAGAPPTDGFDIPAITPLLDQLNVMTYDFYGSWDLLANHNSPLYPSEGGDSNRCVDAAFRFYHVANGVPVEKLNLGVPFYGHAFAACDGLNKPHGGPDTAFLPAEGATFRAIRQLASKCTRVWDDHAKVPYLINSDSRTFISYDDEESISAKARYGAGHRIHGFIIWEITGDAMPDGTRPLLDALNSGFLHPGPLEH